MSGFNASTRTNSQNKNVDKGFCHITADSKATTPEGELLMINFNKLLKMSKGGFFTLHEDTDSDSFYIYTFGKEPSVITKNIINLMDKKHFNIYPNGKMRDLDIEGGIIMNYHDGSFEDLLSHRGVKISVVTETPGKIPLEDRIVANRDIVEFIIDSYGD
jgi:hypothetical protein